MSFWTGWSPQLSFQHGLDASMVEYEKSAASPKWTPISSYELTLCKVLLDKTDVSSLHTLQTRHIFLSAEVAGLQLCSAQGVISLWRTVS